MIAANVTLGVELETVQMNMKVPLFIFDALTYEAVI